MKNKKTKWKKVIVALVGVALLAGIIGGISAFAAKDTTTISSTAFERGALDKNGNHGDSKSSIFTEDAFGCIGLTVVPDFDAHVKYDIYYYDSDDVFLSSVTGIEGRYDKAHPFATHARIVIHPQDADDEKIRFYEVYSIARKLEITVDKKQKSNYSDSTNLFTSAIQNKSFQPLSEDNNVSTFDSSNLADYSTATYKVKVSNKVAVDESYKYYDVFVYLDVGEGMFPHAALFGSDGRVIVADSNYVYDYVDTSTIVKPAWVKMTIEVPELETYEGVHLMVSMPHYSDCYIFGYN